MKEAYDKAWEHVVEYEKQILNDLEDKCDREKQRAESCGCPQCVKYWQHMEDEWEDEYERQFIIPEDSHDRKG